MQDDTLLVHTAREPERHYGIVNPSVYHASTLLYPILEAFSRRADSAEKKGFRVKAPVTRRPPHRSVREQFAHTVPR